ncbi:condensation domain-containing protein, partial [Rhodococcus sp. NPDC054953]
MPENVEESSVESSVQHPRSSVRTALSSAQAGMWFAQQLDPANPTFVTGQCLEIVGPLDPAVLASAVDRVVAESPELRTRIDAGDEITQVPGGWTVPPTATVTVAGWDAALTHMRARLREPIDLTAAAGFGATVLVLGDEHHALFLRAQHTLLDVYGYGLLGRRIAAVYNALDAGTQPPPPRFDPIGKVVDEDRARAGSDRAAADRDFWTAELRGAPDATTPALAPAPPAAAVASVLRARTVTVGADVADLLDGIGRGVGGGWADAVTATIAGQLARVTGELDVTLGFPSMNRMGTAAARVLTTAVNVVPLRVPVDPAAGIAALTAVVRAAVARTAPHTRYRGEDIHRDLRLPATAPGPVGPTVNIKPFGDSLRFTGASATVHSLARGPVRDIAFVVRRLDRTGELEIQIDADAARYTDADLARHAAGLTRMLHAAVAADPALARVTLLEPDAPHAVPRGWSGAAAHDECPDVLSRFDAQVAARPDAPALVAGDERLSYRDLATRVGDLAAELRGRGARPESLVALALPRTADAVVALLAVLRTGAGYVPLDPQFPTARLDHMLADARPAILLAAGDVTDRVEVPETTAVGVLTGGAPVWTADCPGGTAGDGGHPATT